MKETTKIAVILPVKNSAKYLDEAIQSLLKQTFSDFELNIIYDNSSDGSLDIIKKYEKLDHRIQIIEGQNDGLVGALNHGILKSKSTYIARMDADDICHPSRFEEQLNLMESQGADICGSNWIVVNELGVVSDVKLVPVQDYMFPICLSVHVPFAHGSVLIRRSFLERNNLKYLNARCCEDYELWINMCEQGAKFVNSEKFLYYYRENSNSISKNLKKAIALRSHELRVKFVKKNALSIEKAIVEALANLESITQIDKVNLIFASFCLFLAGRSVVVKCVVKKSSMRSVGLSILHVLHKILIRK